MNPYIHTHLFLEKTLNNSLSQEVQFYLEA
jgi:hypothetical protein